MHIESLTKNGCRIFRLSERIIADSDIEDIAGEVEQELAKGRKKIALSFSPPSYPYSPVLSVLTRCQRMAQQKDASIIVITPKQEFIDVLLETHLDRILQIHRSEEELEKALESQ